MASYIGASAEQEDADPILMAFAAEAPPVRRPGSWCSAGRPIW